uniref:Uncharacterized protein n=1 Tax=Heliothis virescens TaxID=7102 RepID=A0A2A4JDL9_HELVI
MELDHSCHRSSSGTHYYTRSPDGRKYNINQAVARGLLMKYLITSQPENTQRAALVRRRAHQLPADQTLAVSRKWRAPSPKSGTHARSGEPVIREGTMSIQTGSRRRDHNNLIIIILQNNNAHYTDTHS